MPARDRLASLKRAVTLGALVVGVTVGGVAAGAFLVSPRMTALARAVRENAESYLTLDRLAIGSGVFVLALSLTLLLPKVRGMSRTGAARVARPSITLAAPAGRRAERTPQAVQALAEAGARPADIAWRTGLSLDAVSLLLAVSTASRQLQPPTA